MLQQLLEKGLTLQTARRDYPRPPPTLVPLLLPAAGKKLAGERGGWFAEQKHPFRNILTGEKESFRFEAGGRYLTSGGVKPSLGTKVTRQAKSKLNAGALESSRNIWTESKSSKSVKIGMPRFGMDLGTSRRRRR